VASFGVKEALKKMVARDGAQDAQRTTRKTYQLERAQRNVAIRSCIDFSLFSVSLINCE
jgi:hypothetical protein